MQIALAKAETCKKPAASSCWLRYAIGWGRKGRRNRITRCGRSPSDTFHTGRRPADDRGSRMTIMPLSYSSTPFLRRSLSIRFTLAGSADHVRQIGVRDLLVDEHAAVVKLLSVRVGQADQCRAQRARLAVHHQIAELRLRQTMMDPHPFHEVDRKIAVLTD